MSSGMEMMVNAAIKALGFDRDKLEAMGKEYIAQAQQIAGTVVQTVSRLENKMDHVIVQQDMILREITGRSAANIDMTDIYAEMAEADPNQLTLAIGVQADGKHGQH